MPDPAELFDYTLPIGGAPLSSIQVRNQFEALARLFYTTDAANPQSPREGQPRIEASDVSNVKLEFYVGGAWRTAIEHLENTSVTVSSRLFFNQTSILDPWVIDHNFDNNPLVQVLDTAGNLLTSPANYTLQHINPNRVIITFGVATAGSAILIA